MYLNELEAAAKRLRDIESGKAKPAADFKLIGMMRIAAAVDSRGQSLRNWRTSAAARAPLRSAPSM